MAKKAVSLDSAITAEYASKYEKVQKLVCIVWARKFGTPEVIAEDIAGNAVFVYHKMKTDGKEYSDGRFFGTLKKMTTHWKDPNKEFCSIDSRDKEPGLEKYLGVEDNSLEVSVEYQYSIQMLARKFGRDSNITKNILDDINAGYSIPETANRNGVKVTEIKGIIRDFNI
ncbi:MAG: hypothetical protein JNL74_07910 [Fibrobacteres bacterium]|nr:hypothetical protein [Fibrobacterota bacterium]